MFDDEAKKVRSLKSRAADELEVFAPALCPAGNPDSPSTRSGIPRDRLKALSLSKSRRR
jgi:hypothetical protein